MTCSPNSKGTPAEAQQDDSNNVVAFPDQLERDIQALWRREAQMRALAAFERSSEEMQALYEERERIIPWLLKYPQFNPYPNLPAPMSDADITKMLSNIPIRSGAKRGAPGNGAGFRPTMSPGEMILFASPTPTPNRKRQGLRRRNAHRTIARRGFRAAKRMGATRLFRTSRI